MTAYNIRGPHLVSPAVEADGITVGDTVDVPFPVEPVRPSGWRSRSKSMRVTEMRWPTLTAINHGDVDWPHDDEVTTTVLDVGGIAVAAPLRWA